MKKLGILFFSLTSSLVHAADFAIQDPSKGIFDAQSKVAQTVFSVEWIVKGGAGLFAISCFVSSANLARQGQYGRATGAVIAGIISSIGPYLVSLSQS